MTCIYGYGELKGLPKTTNHLYYNSQECLTFMPEFLIDKHHCKKPQGSGETDILWELGQKSHDNPKHKQSSEWL